MKVKKLTKTFAVIMALALMISAFPLGNFSLFAQKASAASNEMNTAIEFDENGNANADKACMKYNAVDADIFMWLTNDITQAASRCYKVDVVLGAKNNDLRYSETISQNFELQDIVFVGSALTVTQTENGFNVSLKESQDIESLFNRDLSFSYILKAKDNVDIAGTVFSSVTIGETQTSYLINEGVYTQENLSVDLVNANGLQATLKNANGTSTAILYSKEKNNPSAEASQINADIQLGENDWTELERKETAENSFVFETQPIGNTDYLVVVEDALGYTARANVSVEPTVVAATFGAARSTSVVRPTNDLGRYDDATNIVTQTLSQINNTGTSELTNAEVVIDLPVNNSKGENIDMQLQSFSSGTYDGDNGTVYLDVYYKTNVTSTWRMALNHFSAGNAESKIINVESLNLGSGEYVTALKYSFGTLPIGFKVYKAPEIKSALFYTGTSEFFTITNKAELSANELAAPIVSTEVTQVENPLVTLTILYKDIDTDAVIPYDSSYAKYGDWSIVTKTYPIYSQFSNMGRVNIPNYTTPATGADVHPTNVINYNANTFSGYVGNTDVTIVHYYKALKTDLMVPSIVSKYDTVYTNDKNAFYIDNLGSKYDENSGTGNTPLNSFTVNVQVPTEMSVNEIITPSFNNGSGVTMTVFYKTSQNSAWRQEDIGLRASDMHTVTFDLAENEKITEIEMRFVADSGTIPANFYNLNRGIIKGVVQHDRTEAFTVTGKVTSIAQYTVTDLINGKDITNTISKSDVDTVNVIVPQLVDITDGHAARLQAGDKFAYVLNAIQADGSVAMKNYTIEDLLPENVIVTSVQTGVFSGIVNSTYTVIITKADGTVITENCNSAVNKTISVNGSVQSIVFRFPSVGKTFKAVSAPIIQAVVCDDAPTGGSLTNKVNITADWISANEPQSGNALDKSFISVTKIVKAELKKPSVSVAGELFNAQHAVYTISNIGNKGNTEIYDFAFEICVPNDTVLSSVTTGSWVNTDWNGNSMEIQYKTEDGNWQALKTVTEFSKNETISVPDTDSRITSVRYLIKVAPIGFAENVAPAVNVKVDTGLDEGHIIATSVAVSGKFGPTTEADPTTVPDTVNFNDVETQRANISSKIVVPKMSKATLNAPTEIRFDKQIEYSINNFKNEGKTYLYDTNFVFDISGKTKVDLLTTGSWMNAENYAIQYKKDTVNLVTDENGEQKTETVTSEWLTLADSVSPSVNGEVSLPELSENERITSIRFVFNTVPAGFAMKDSPKLTVSIEENVMAGEELPIKFTYNALGGYAANPESPTSDELSDMPHNFTTEAVLTSLVIKPVIAVPQMLVPSDTLKYREKFTYTINNIKNEGNTVIENAYVIVSLDRVRLVSILTPTFNADGKYNILYRTNTNADWRTWKKNISMAKETELFAPELQEDEYITDVILQIGATEPGFESVSDWKLNVINWSDAYDMENVIATVEVNGEYEELTFSSKNRALYSPVLPELLAANISKTYPTSVYPKLEYESMYQNVVNNTEADIEYFALTDAFDEKVHPVSISTGVYTAGLNNGYLQVLYQTSKSGDGWYELIKKQSVTENKTVDFPELDGEYITNVKLVYGTVQPGFKATNFPSIKTKFTEAIQNHTELTGKLYLTGFIDGKVYKESFDYQMTADYGYVEVELYNIDTGEKIGDNGRFYGNMNEPYTITDYPIKGYKLVKIDGTTTGTMKDGYTDTVKVYYKALPKTGENPFLTWNFIAGASILLVVGVSMIASIPKKKKEDEIA